MDDLELIIVILGINLIKFREHNVMVIQVGILLVVLASKQMRMID
jgi:hypothetical protein